MKMIKKIFYIVLTSMLIMTFIACGKNDTDSKDKNDNDTEAINSADETDKSDDKNDLKEDETEEPGDTSEESNDEKPEEGEKDTSSNEDEYIPKFIHEGEPIGYTQYNFFDAELYVKAPAYHRVSHGVENFHYGMNLTIGYYSGRKKLMEDIEVVEDVLGALEERLIRGTSRYVYGEFEKFEFDSIEEMRICDIDMIRYEGQMTVTGYDEDHSKRYVVAYTFIHNGTPNAIFGVVGSSTQEQQHIDDLINNVDESVKTIVPKNP